MVPVMIGLMFIAYLSVKDIYNYILINIKDDEIKYKKKKKLLVKFYNKHIQ